MTDEELVYALRNDVGVSDYARKAAILAADLIEQLVKELDDKSENALMWQNAFLEENDRVFQEWKKRDKIETNLAKAVGVLKLTYSTLTEINPSNYDHDEVCELNNASVEAIYSIAAVLAELEETE